MRIVTRISFILAALALLVACSAAPAGRDGDRGGGSDDGAGGGGGSAVGPGISVDEAIASTLEGPLLVNGYLVASGDEVRFCSALAESHPPQCGGSSLVVEGLDLDEMQGLSSASGVTWSDEQLQLLGSVEDGVLRIEANAVP